MTWRSTTRGLLPWLLPPLLLFGESGCCAGGGAVVPISTVLFRATLWLGERALETAVGVTIEKALDALFAKWNAPQTNQGDDVDIDSQNPLRGTSRQTMKITLGDGREVFLLNPAVVRDSPSSPWKLDPVVKERAQKGLEQMPPKGTTA